MNFNKLFSPQSIAIIGASRTEKTVGNEIVRNLTSQFKGKIYPINPKAETLYGLKVYADITQIPDEIDLGIIAIPAQAVLQVIKQSFEQKKLNTFIVISSGFKEAGNEKLETELKTYCQKNKITLLGPNCLGVINPYHQMNASFANLMPKAGKLSFISQSGALVTSILDYSRKLELGFAKFASIGNKAIIDELSLLEYLGQDQDTKVIGMYVEQLQDAPQFIKIVKKITTGKNAKPIIILKAGKTQAGSEAVASHTGSLAGGRQAYDGLFAQANIIQAESINQLFDYAAIFSENELRTVEKVAIVTNAGGPGVLATDALINAGLTLAQLTTPSQTKLKSFLPEAASIHNPIDILGDANAQRYDKTLQLSHDRNCSDRSSHCQTQKIN